MKAVNKLFKFFGYVVVYMITFLQCYCMSLLVSGSLLSIVCAVLSIVMKLPAIFIESFWLIYLITAIPIAVIFFIIVVTNAVNKQYRFKKEM